ncbi:heterogeneous nuclear ribonucleoprotein A3, putative [Eimeria brunetti]|uniref:Heterogeneous nuclear ribonucleoprotein A3, putative n=1 Tax=Eimeria brunetti TaxID=51314 RepID=U6LV79_9EIME|nr:heterogeneous nuclear ribonucleoprotein A3, putative [Eimeria brunetti]
MRASPSSQALKAKLLLLLLLLLQQQQQMAGCLCIGKASCISSTATFSESLREYFSSFGPVYHTEVLFDKLTGRSRGFGFVTFEEVETINNVVDRHHTIDESQQRQQQRQQQQQQQQRNRQLQRQQKELQQRQDNQLQQEHQQQGSYRLQLQQQQQLLLQQQQQQQQQQNWSVEVRRAIPREEARNAQPRRSERESAENSGRVFIGGLGDEVTDGGGSEGLFLPLRRIDFRQRNGRQRNQQAERRKRRGPSLDPKPPAFECSEWELDLDPLKIQD